MEGVGPLFAVDPDETFDLLDEEVWTYFLEEGKTRS